MNKFEGMRMEDSNPEHGKDARNKEFRQLVEDLVNESGLFPPKANPIKPEEKFDILTSIERNEISLYADDHTDDRTQDAVSYLVAIYDELAKDEPDEEFIEDTVEGLKQCL